MQENRKFMSDSHESLFVSVTLDLLVKTRETEFVV